MEQTVASPPPALGLKEVRASVQDLFAVRPGRYWSDLLASAVAGWAGFASAVFAPAPSLRAVGFAIGTLALYRALLFIHELTHVAREGLPGFTLAWNAVVGIPLMVPSCTYVGVHTDHHRRNVYGTAEDPEYLPLAAGPRSRLVRFLVEATLAPAAFALRFLVASPVGWLLPRFRARLERHASSLVINLRYRRRALSPKEQREMRVLEVAILLVWGTLLVLAARGVLPWRIFGAWYATSAAVAVLNQIRTLGAHRYRNGGAPMDMAGQLEDSVNILTGPLGALYAPVGLRYHALHHYLPDLPYHSLAEAHQRLSESLPARSVYHRVNARSLHAVVAALWREARGAPAPTDDPRAVPSAEPPACPSSTSTAS